ncbi:MAG: acyltransferase family protein [Hyphomicrobiales bacterium]|nr:acyltransferase family protein [Hyphomicrobiales bacterium]
MSEARRYDWVDAAKGLSIILVVMMYAAYNVGKYTGEVGVLHYVIGFATPFRMPEFFLISGLFLSQVIQREWRRYADRRVVHYLYFYFLWVAIDYVLKVGIAGRDIPGVFSGIAFAIVQPYGVLWFIYMLAVFSFVTKLAWQAKLPHWLVIAVAAALQMAQIESPSYAVTQFCAHFVFFYLGYAGSRYVFQIVDAASRRPALAWGALAIWALAEAFLVFWPDGHPEPMEMHMGLAAFPPLHLVLAVAGSIALCVLGSLLMRLPYTNWLRWLGEHSIVVYLSFTLPMSAVRIIAMKSGILTGTSALSVVVLAVSLAAPVVFYLLIKRFKVGEFLFERPAWAHIPGTLGSTDKNLAVRPAQ